MKKIIVLYVLAICLCLSACKIIPERSELSDVEEIGLQSVPKFDSQGKYMMTIAVSFQETDDFFCGSNFTGNFLQYYDKVSGVSGVLCADPACTHDSSNCGAYMQSGANLAIYDGKLYWVGQDTQSSRDYYLWRSDLSGMEREKIKRLSFENVIMEYQPQRYVVHRGKLYLLGNINTLNGTQSSCRDILVSSPLDDSEEFTVLYEKVTNVGMNTTVRFVGDHVYISAVTFPEGGPCDITVTKLNLTTGALETIYAEAEIPQNLGTAWVTEQGDIFLPGVDEDCAYVWKVENGKRVEIVTWSGAEPSLPNVMDGIAVFLSRPNGVRLAEIIDLKGEKIYSGLLFPEGIPGLDGDPNAYSFAVVGGDKDKMILNLQNFTESGMVDYTVMLDMNDNLTPTILWSNYR